MLRRVDNPPNPFTSEYAEWLEEPPTAALEVYEEHARSIISENDSPDVGFRFSVNPYRGCQHACAYCYARPTHEYLDMGAGSDFDTRITVKVNAPELLAQAFRKRSWKRETLVFSGVTDCYQPLEAVYRVTQRCLEVCRDFSNPVGLVTKSFLVARDAALLASIQQRAAARLYMSIAFARDDRSRKIEWGAPPPSRRFEAMRRLHEAGVPVGVMIAPVIPGLNDREIPEILERAAENGARSAGFVPLRLPGSVKDVFLSRVRSEMPDAARRIEALVRDMRGGQLNDPRFGARMRGEGPYWASVRQLFEKSCRRLGFPAREAGEEVNAKPIAPQTRVPVQLPLF